MFGYYRDRLFLAFSDFSSIPFCFLFWVSSETYNVLVLQRRVFFLRSSNTVTRTFTLADKKHTRFFLHARTPYFVYFQWEIARLVFICIRARRFALRHTKTNYRDRLKIKFRRKQTPVRLGSHRTTSCILRYC